MFSKKSGNYKCINLWMVIGQRIREKSSPHLLPTVFQTLLVFILQPARSGLCCTIIISSLSGLINCNFCRRLGCAVFATFFIRSLSKRIWILFASYSHISVHANIHFLILANFCFKICEFHISANICMWIFACKYSHTREYTLRIACKYSHTREYSLRIASNYIGKAFTSLRPQLIFVVLKIFTSFCLKIFALKRKK
jgi:hypothetical protein